jgi:peptidoglycan hydrolase CwlO-like protein
MEKKLSNKKLRIFIFSILSFAIVIYPFMISKNVVVKATSSIGILQQQYNNLQNLISQNQAKINQNNGNIANLQSRINSYQQLIFQKQVLVNNEKAQVNQLDSQIIILNNQIASEENQIAVLKGKIDQNAKSGYEETYVPPVTMFMGNSNINSDIASVVYFKATISHENSLVIKMNTLISSLNSNKASLQLKQRDAQSLLNQEVSTENSLIADQNSLRNEQNSLQSTNSSLQASNGSLQSQAQQIQSEMVYIENLTNNGGYVPPDCGNFGGQPDSSWYSNQLCSGNYMVYWYGCLATDLSMLSQYYNHYFINPANLMNSGGYLTGYPDINGGQPTVYGSFLNKHGYYFNSTQVNAILNSGTPVIAGMWPVSGGSHYVILIKPLSNGDYLINNPSGSGPDETLYQDGFNTSLIHQIIYY